MKMLILAGAIVLTMTLLPAAVNARTPPPSDGPGQFRFHLEESNTPRGKAVEGYIYNESPWRITNTRPPSALGALVRWCRGRPQP